MNIRIPLAFACISLFCLPLMAGERESGIRFKSGKKLVVQTQILFAGVDLYRVLTPEEGNPFCDPEETQLCLPSIVDGMVTTLDATDFNERAEALAKQISRDKPDIVGLQRVALWRTQSPGDVAVNGLADAEDVLYDFLEILQDALRAKGAHYEVAAMVQDFDVELPRLVGFDGQVPLLDDVRFTDRDVILVRRNVDVSNVVEQNYATNLSVSLAGRSVEITRGYAAIDAKVKGVTYRFVSTLIEPIDETGDDSIQAAQAAELIAALANEQKPVIVVGALFSTPEDADTTSVGQLSASNYVDMWSRRNIPSAGPTCCQDEDLLNEESILSDRHDYIFVRNDLGYLPYSSVGPVSRIDTVGEEPQDKTRSGLWPSNHAGIVARLKVPRLSLTPNAN
jgi:endonuclease/exonuclease/phosphatase family metal-dependent hydrolase